MQEIKKFNRFIVANWKLNGSFSFINTFISSMSLKNAIKGIENKTGKKPIFRYSTGYILSTDHFQNWEVPRILSTYQHASF